MKVKVTILNNIVANLIQQYINRIMYLDKIGFIPELQAYFIIQKPINVVHISNSKRKTI